MKSSYASKWILQRVTALILIPLIFWFIYQCISFQNLNYLEIQFFFNSSLNCFLFLIMTFFMLIHSKIGCDTIIQDYISSKYLRNSFKILINLATLFLLLLTIISIIKLNFFL